MSGSVRRAATGNLFLVTVVLFLAQPAAGTLIWFDEKNGGGGFAGFAELAAAYTGFLGTPANRITFDGVPGLATVTDRYKAEFGVTFANSGGGKHDPLSGVHDEGDAVVGSLTGYDGTYMPSGNRVYVRFDNDNPSRPFTVRFDEPAGCVGAFLATGPEGRKHAIRVSLFDPSGALIGRRDVESRPWDADAQAQNHETFFAARTHDVAIGRVEIRNLAHQGFAGALVIDNLAWSGLCDPEPVPEPGACLLWALVGIMISSGKWRVRTARRDGLRGEP